MSSKIDITKIKPGDEVEIAHGDYCKVNHTFIGGGVHIQFNGVDVYLPVGTPLITDLRPAQPERVSIDEAIENTWPSKQKPFEWLTEDEFSDLHAKWHMEPKTDFRDMVNAKLTAKFHHGPLIVKTATGEEEASNDIVVTWLEILRVPIFMQKCSLDKGDRYIELPDLSKEGAS